MLCCVFLSQVEYGIVYFIYYAILRAFALHSYYGDSSLNKKLNGHHAFESMSLLGALISAMK